MEEAKVELEKKVSMLLDFIQNRKKIPNVTKKELVRFVYDLQEHCHHLLFQQGNLGTNASSNSDSEYYSSEETEISLGNVTETLSLDCAAMLRKLQETELCNEDFVKQVSNLKQETDFLRDQNMELAGDIEGKRSEDREYSKGLMSNGEATLLRKQNKELELELEKKTIQVSETTMRLKRLEEETNEQAKTELRILEEKDALWNKVQKLQTSFDALQKQRKELSEENQKIRTRIAEKEREMKNIEDKTKKLVNEQEEIIHRLSVEIKDQHKLVKEQKDAIDKLSEDQKLMKRWSFGSKSINTNLVERKMEELAEDFKMKTEDHIRILDRRIHAAEQIHLESKTHENRVSETEIKKIKEMVEQGLAGPEKAIKKLEEGEELVKRVSRIAKEVDSARKWVKEKKSERKDEVETLEAKLECKEAQESLVKEKLSKLEAKLAEEGTGKMSLEKAMRRIKKLEINAKEKEFELLSLEEGKREAIRQLCVLMDYQRCRYDDLKTSIFKVALQA